MKVYTNETVIKRNRKIGQYTTIASLVVLGIGLYLSFKPSSQMVTFSLIALLLGFTLSQVGIYFGNRWGRSPRPDEVITSSLKGLDDKYALYHYTSPVPHLLLGPSGVWVIIPYHATGRIIYEKDRWRQKGASFFTKVFGQDSIGRPDVQVKDEVETIRQRIAKTLPEAEIPSIQAALVFTNEKTKLEAEDAPVPTLPASKLKDYIRKRARENPLPPDELNDLEVALYTA